MIVNIISCECLDYTPEISFEVCESTEVYNADGSFNRLRIIDKDFDNMDFKTINKETVKNINSQKEPLINSFIGALFYTRKNCLILLKILLNIFN